MENPIRTVIVDDEPLAREGIRLLLAGHPGITVVAECANGHEAAAAIATHAPDLVFLDVQMPGMDGFGVVRQIASDRMPMVVFVTAFDTFAIQAFEAHALDYLVKPVNKKRFEETLRFVKSRHREKTAQAVTDRLLAMLAETEYPKTSAPARIPVRQGDRIYFVAVSEIDYIDSADNYVNLHAGRKTHLMRGSLAAFERTLDPKRFVRIHRSVIVNVERIQELQPHLQGEYFVILRDGTRLKLSRTYRDSISAILGE